MTRSIPRGCHVAASIGEHARVQGGTTPVAHKDGCLEARIEMRDAEGGWVPKHGFNSFFPADWSLARLQYEVSQAFSQGSPGRRFKALSPGGVFIQFEWDDAAQRTVFYPLGAGE